MSLRVWLPLTKDLRQQGLSDITFTNNGVTFSNSGKLGGSYYFANEHVLSATNFSIGANAWSICYWVKYTALPTSSNFYQVTLNTSSSTDCLFMVGGYSANGSTGVFRCNMTGDCGTINKDVWYHVCATYDGSKSNLYIDGVLLKTFNITVNANKKNLTIGGRSNNSSNTAWVGTSGYCYMNDVRIYNNCLSPMEVKELAKGLVLHYPLSDNSIQQLNNCYTNPTFNSSSANAGWSHWGSTGHQGTYGQSTDSNYIYRKGQTYAHWVADGAGATYNYLFYQSPAFEGGHRSLQCICKEENSLPITETIVYPAWNARSGGTPSNLWTSITPLGNGFYHCKCEDIQQDGSNDLVGFYIRAGYKVYFSEAYLENDRTVCSDIFYPTDIIYDCSGFCNNGTKTGTFTCSSDTPKYSVSTYFPNTTTTTTFDDKCWITAPFILNDINQLTISFWFKKEAITRGGLFTTSIATHTGTDLTVDDYDNSVKIRASDGTSVTLGSYDNLIPANTWCHWVVTFDGINVKVYVNSILKNTVSYSAAKMLKNITNITLGANKAGSVHRTAKGNYSDFRIYATALSASDVQSLYQNEAYINDNNIIYGQVR